jgi:F-type H+-transporting ATPase subunit beta
MATTTGAVGKVSQVIGSTLDAEFPEDSLPSIYNALKTEVATTVSGKTEMQTLWCEVAQHLGGGRVRAISLGSTDGLARGARIEDTGAPVSVPVGEARWAGCSTWSARPSTGAARSTSASAVRFTTNRPSSRT